MIFKDIATQKNDSQKLADISLTKGNSNALWHELDETSQAAVSGGGTIVVTNNRDSGGSLGVSLCGIVAGDITPIEEIGIVGVRE
ncbi:hypothetical protein QUB14_28275 [Microcoleus sp. B3-D2]